MKEADDFPDDIVLSKGGSADIKTKAERKIQTIYGTGTYISDFYETSDGNLSIEIGNTFPKDVTDCRPGEKPVIKFIDVDNIATLEGEVVANKRYVISLESRESVTEGFEDEKQNLRESLGEAMARATYDKIAQSPAVENQLNPIKQLLRWTRLYHPASYQKVKDAQDKEDEKTLTYVQTLESLGFIRFDGKYLYAEEPLNKYDLNQISTKEFNEQILGEVVERGYHHLSEKLGLNILRHLPKYANGYYFDAIEKEDPELYLDLDSIKENIIDLYGSQPNLHQWVLRDKMDELVSLDILEESDDYYFASKNTYYDVREKAVG